MLSFDQGLLNWKAAVSEGMEDILTDHRNTQTMKTVIVSKADLFDEKDECFVFLSNQLQDALHRISSLRIDQNDFIEILTSQDHITCISVFSPIAAIKNSAVAVEGSISTAHQYHFHMETQVRKCIVFHDLYFMEFAFAFNEV